MQTNSYFVATNLTIEDVTNHWRLSNYDFEDWFPEISCEIWRTLSTLCEVRDISSSFLVGEFSVNAIYAYIRVIHLKIYGNCSCVKNFVTR